VTARVVPLFPDSRSLDGTAPPFGGAAGGAQVPAVDGTAPPFGGAAGGAQVPAVDELSDEALVAACAVGDPLALGALYDRHHQPLLRFLVRLVGTSSDLEDLVQATFLEVHRSAKRFRGAAAVRTWIFAIAANLHRRARKRQRSDTAKAELGRDAAPLGIVPGPDEAIERRQLVRRVEQAMRTLPLDLRTAFLMCDVEEMRGVDAARALGIREGTLWRRLHDARKRLRAELEGSAR
jgi:RNA polymerase sigma-70 factor (ECF subfamily)